MQNRLRFELERFILRGLGHRLLIAAGIVAVVALVGGLLLVQLDTGYDGDAGEAIWWAFLRLTDPGYLGDDEGVARRAISTVVTVLGYMLFLGLLIAILTQWLNQLIARLESGVTPVAVRDHVIILGWTHRTPTIVLELLGTRRRVQRFLERHGARELRIVILAEHVDARLTAELRARVGARWNDRQVMLRSGSPLHLAHLERVAFRDAAVVILPGADHAADNPAAVDAQTVKTLLAISKHAGENGRMPSLAVAEIFDGRNAEVSQRAFAGESEIVAGDEIMGRLIAQSVQQRGLCDVYLELLTLNAGNTLYVRSLEGEAGSTLGELCGAYDEAIPLGVVRSEAGSRAVFETEADTLLEAEDLLVLMARRYHHCARRAGGRIGPPRASHKQARPASERRNRLLILGWSRKAPALLREFARYGAGRFEIDLVSAMPLAERERLLARYELGAAENDLRHIESNYAVPGVIASLAPHTYDHIVLLASEHHAVEDEADANTAMAYLTLLALLPDDGSGPSILVELLDEENVFLFEKDRDSERDDVIVSPLVVSYMLSQVALRRELGVILTSLSAPWGPQIVLHSATDFVGADGEANFDSLQAAAAERGEILLGVRLAEGGLHLNPPRSDRYRLSEGDEVVVLVTYDEPESRAS